MKITSAGRRSNSSGNGIDSSITSWTQLQAVSTISLNAGYAKMFIDSNNVLITVVLRTGTDATDIVNGVARPNDYNSSTNTKIWLQVNT